MLGGFSFKARGVSVFLDKAQDLQKINSFLQLVSNIPGVLTRINIDELLENIIIGIGWNPSKILMNPASPGVYPPAVQGGQAQAQAQGDEAMAGKEGQLTPMQMLAGAAGARTGGSRNNPQANAHMPLGTPAARSAQ
jgi:hypothetical protein